MATNGTPPRKQPEVLCVSSAAWLATAHVPRMLHGAGARVSFLGPAEAWPLRGSHVDRWLPVEGDAAAVARALREHLQTAPAYDWVVIGDDPLLAAIASHRDEAWARAVLPIEPDDERVGFFGSKVGFIRSAQALGLAVPPSRECLGAERIARACRELGPAVLVKEDALSGGEGCHLITDPAAVRSLPERALTAPVVVQALVTGPTWSVEALYQKGRLASVLTSQVVRSWPGRFGPSAVRRFVHQRELCALAAEIGRKVGVHGFANITVVQDASDGRLFLIELDPRPNALFHLGDVLGVRMTDSLHDLITRRERRRGPRRLPTGLDIEIPVYPGDVLRCLVDRDVRGLAAWALDLDGRRRFMPRGDPRLASAYRHYIVRQLLRRVLPLGLRAPLSAAWQRMKR